MINFHYSRASDVMDAVQQIRADPAATLSLTCAVPTAYHAAHSAGVQKGSTVVIVGDGAVGLAAVQAVRLLGAARVLVVGGEHAIGRTGGTSTVLECVGTQTSWTTAVAVARDGGRIGHIGTPHPVERLDVSRLFDRNISLAGGLTHAGIRRLQARYRVLYAVIGVALILALWR